jgi:periplasmic protein TonB
MSNVTQAPGGPEQWEQIALATANDRFKAGYGRTLQTTTLVSFVVYLLLFLFTPELKITPYRLPDDTIEVVDIPTAIDIPPPPQELPKPQVPVEAAPDADVEEDIDIAETLPEDFSAPLPTMGTGGPAGNEFVAFDEKPEIVQYVPPQYSEFAREAGLEGLVMVDVLVGTDGRVKDARVSRSVHSVLDQAALVAARRARFTPGKQRNIPVEVWVTLPYNFTLF